MSKKILTALALSAVILTATGCGKQAFVVSNTVQKQQGPGTFIIPPKVDILLAEDDTGGILEIQQQIQAQMPGFLTRLNGMGWDYHFATTPLTTNRALNQIIASKYDSNWGAQWTKPYPWATPGEPGTIEPQFFRRPDNYSDFVVQNNSGTGAVEDGFDTIATAFQSYVPQTSFLRPDAILVVLALSTGEDTSKVNKCMNSSGSVLDCEQVGQPECSSLSQYDPNVAPANAPHCGTRDLSFNTYKNALQGLKMLPSMAQFHALVSSSWIRNGSCHGGGGANNGNAFAGTRYIQMASQTGGRNYDICTQSVSSVLAQLQANLQNTRIAFKTRYVFIGDQPDTSTIRVVKYVNNDPNQAIELPEDPTNGWTYVGWVDNVYAIDEPVPMNLTSGYAIQLNGSAKLEGDDTADVMYRPVGVSNSSS